MPHERLLVDNDADNRCALAPPSLPADIYGVALTIMQMWTLRRPFYGMRDEYELIRTLRKLKTGQLAQLERPDGVPASVWAVLQDCMKVEQQVRPTAEMLLARFYAL